ncbi:MAG: hypothetical protein AAGI63_09345, partial [Planctomycetota bacterium]
MHRDVKRSLFLWPAAASLTISAAAWYAQNGMDLEPIRPNAISVTEDTRQRIIESSQVDLAVPMAHRGFDTDDPPTLRLDVPAPVEHGMRAMQLPERIAEVYGVASHTVVAPQTVVAPVRDPQTELAGWVESELIECPQDEAHSSCRVFPTVQTDELAPTEQTDTRLTPSIENISIDPVDYRTAIPTSVDPSSSPSDWVSTAGTYASEEVISRSHPCFPSVLQIDGFNYQLFPDSIRPRSTGSVLPKSTRVLAKPADNTAMVERPTATIESIAAEDGASETIETEAFPALSDLQFPVAPEPVSFGDLPHPLQSDANSPSSDSISRQEIGRANPAPEQALPRVPEIVIPAQSEAEKQRADAAIIEPHNPLGGWPTTTALNEQLDDLAQYASDDLQQWIQNINDTLLQLRSLSRLGDPEAGFLLDELKSLAESGLRSAEQVDDRDQQVDWLLASYALTRRVEIWKPIWQLGQPAWMVSDLTIDSPAKPDEKDAVSLNATIADLRRDISVTGDKQAWSEFFLLNEMEQAAKEANSRDRTVLAQRVLSRLEWHGLEPEQQRWLNRDAVTQLASVVRPWARGAVDYANLLRQLERQEANAIDLGSIDIANSIQSLRFAESPAVAEIGRQIDRHYRNANIRLAISQQMLERAIPAMDPQQIPVRTTILGSRVRGTSNIQSDLRIQLYPSANRWKLDLLALGDVRTNSTGFNSGVSVRTLGNANFEASTPIEIRADGIDIRDANANVRGATRLRGISSKYDDWPVLGTFVRNIARSRYKAIQTQTNRIANQTIRDQVKQEFDDRLTQQVDQATERLGEMVLGPLGRMKLDPKVMDL